MHIQTICICKYFRFYFVFCFDFIEYYLNLQLWNMNNDYAFRGYDQNTFTKERLMSFFIYTSNKYIAQSLKR